MTKKFSSNTKRLYNRNIPLPLQREIRQRCGFGCVVCGFPLYEYHHIERWADVQEHTANNITLLCPAHHHQAGSGLLPKSKIIDANKFPFNQMMGRSSKYFLHYEGDSVNVIMGRNTFTFPKKNPEQFTLMVPLMIYGTAIISFVSEYNNLLLNLTLRDSSNQLVLKIVNNHLFYSISSWDVQFVNRTLTIREKPRNFLVKMTFNPPDTVVIEEGRIYYDDIEVIIDYERLLIFKNGNKIIDSEDTTFVPQGDLAVGILIGALPAEYENLGVAICIAYGSLKSHLNKTHS